jgi:C-terminal processing protease CtpA/Prc
MRKLRIAALCVMVAAASSACKKDPKATPPPTPPEGTRLQLSLDSLYLYAKETYLWYDVLPDYNTFNPRSFAGDDELTSLKAELYKISQYKINSVTSQPYEYTGTVNRPKYSFVETGNAAQGIKGSIDLDGQGNDMGIGLVIASDGTNKYVYVRFVEKGSSADLAGITRGCRVTTMNGAAVSTDATTLNNALNANSMSLTLQRAIPASGTFSANLTKGTYTNDPVTVYKTFPASGTNITGYLNLARFSQLSVAQPTMDKAFQEFATKGVNNLIIDLRYNGGGYVATFEYLANLIAPASLTGQVMYKETYNTLMQNGNAPILKYIPLLGADGKQRTGSGGRLLTYADVDYSTTANTYKFSKKGTLGTIKNVVFIVSGNTASASELTINSLKAYPANMTVKLVGSATTYGKPVGFFGIGIDKFTVYMSQFTSVNANGEGGYFAGMTVDIASTDDIQHDFGDAAENGISKALAFINTGAGGRTSNDRLMTINGRVVNADAVTLKQVGGESFNGMVEERVRLK